MQKNTILPMLEENKRLFYITYLVSCVLLICFAGCNNEQKKVENNLKRMTSQHISLGLNEMQCRRMPISRKSSSYKMVVYIDSTECTPCSLNKLRFWNPLINLAKRENIKIDYIFIVAPKPSEMDDINLELSVTDLQSSIYLDTAYVFRKRNSSIPNENKYHSFLLDKNDNICFVGNPIDNEKLMMVYKKAIGLKQQIK